MKEYEDGVSWDEYKLIALTRIEDVDLFSVILDNISNADISNDIITDIFNDYKERALGHKAALLAIDVTEGKKSLSDLKDLLSDVETNEPKEEIEFVTTNLEDLYENHVRKQGLRWRLKTLNKVLGSLRKGDFGFLFARPETGKTTFLASETTFMAEQLCDEAGPIIWFNNEEEGRKVQLRIFQASLGITLQELFLHRAENYEKYLAKTKDKIKIIDAAIIDRNRVERVCKQLNPSLILFDQLDKIKGFDGDREDLRLGYIYQWARELAKTYCPVIAVCQADGSGEGKKWLTMDNVANAKTAKQAEADWILGIGATHNEGFEFIRHLHASKNKLTGDLDSDNSLRHGRVDVIIQPDIARYSDYD